MKMILLCCLMMKELNDKSLGSFEGNMNELKQPSMSHLAGVIYFRKERN